MRRPLSWWRSSLKNLRFEAPFVGGWVACVSVARLASRPEFKLSITVRHGRGAQRVRDGGRASHGDPDAGDREAVDGVGDRSQSRGPHPELALDDVGHQV